MANAPLIFVANPGSTSRKYGLYEGETARAIIHVEYIDGQIRCTVTIGGKPKEVPAPFKDITGAAEHVLPLLRQYGALDEGEHISRLGLRIVAPGAFFLHDHLIDEAVITRLEMLRIQAPLHIEAMLHELIVLRKQLPSTPMYGVSDSAFHITKPDYAWNYGLPLEDADHLDIKRFGYQGLSVSSVVHALKAADKCPPRLIVCHIGNGVSATAILNGEGFDTTMGYSPLEGVIMATRSGSMDVTAARTLQAALNLNDQQFDSYLHTQGGLLGLGGSSDVRELLEREMQGDGRAHLGLKTYVYSIQKAIGQMTAALGGADMLVFTGTVGERSAPLRHRIVQRLHYLDFFIDEEANHAAMPSGQPHCISRLAHSRPLFVVPADETGAMARRITD